MAYCPSCGTLIDSDAVNCSSCDAVFGAQDGWKPANQPPPAPPSAAYYAGFMLIITACLLTFIAFLLLPTGVLVYLVVAGPVVGVGYLLMLIGKSGRGKHGSSEPGEM